MKKLKAETIRPYTDLEIVALIDEKQRELAELRFSARISPIENPARIRVLRRDIARLKTVQAEQRATSTPNAQG